MRSGSCWSKFFEIWIFDWRSGAPTKFFILFFFSKLQGTVTSNCRNLFNLFRFSTILSEPAMTDVRIYQYRYGIMAKYGFLYRFWRKHKVLVLLHFGYAGKTCSEVMFNTVFEMLIENTLETKKLLLLYNTRFWQITDCSTNFIIIRYQTEL